MLDIGCGHGSLAGCLANEGAEVLAIDLDEERLEIARKYNSSERIRYESIDIGSLEHTQFDVITAFDVLEHVRSYEKILEQSRYRLSPTGFIAIEYNPYFSLIGHHLYDFTLLPVQFLPYRWTERIVLSRPDRGGIFSAEECLKQYRELNRISARGLRKACRNNGLRIVFERNEMNIPGWRTLNTRMFRHIPYLEDLFSFAHILFLRADRIN